MTTDSPSISPAHSPVLHVETTMTVRRTISAADLGLAADEIRSTTVDDLIALAVSYGAHIPATDGDITRRHETFADARESTAPAPQQ